MSTESIIGTWLKQQIKIGFPGDDFVLDLSKASFRTCWGPYDAGKEPDVWPAPTGDWPPEAPNPARYCISLGNDIPDKPVTNLTVVGGMIRGLASPMMPWRVSKHLYDGDAVRLEGRGFLQCIGTQAENVHDFFSPRGGGEFLVRDCHVKNVRDDFIENDQCQSGTIDHCRVEKCHVFLSERPGNPIPGRTNSIVAIKNSLIHCGYQPYDGDGQQQNQIFLKNGEGVGMLFKWSTSAGRVQVQDTIFRMDGMSVNGPTPMKFPPGDYSNVTLVWLGEGDYPQKLPIGVTVTKNVAVWDTAFNAWSSGAGE